MNRIMLNGTVLIKRLDVEKKLTDGGLEIPDIAQVRSNRGEVVAIGADEKEIVVGDVVVFTRYGGTDVDVDKEELIIVNRKQLYWIEKQPVLMLGAGDSMDPRA
jgi:chaperonin GroES